MSKLFSALGTPMTQVQYAQEWKVDGEHISNDGHHFWMAEQLGQQNLVVEIGCGAGASTLTLAKKSRVICIESNPTLVEFCKDNLLANNVSAQVLTISELTEATSQVVIVHCDIFDLSIEQHLKAMKPTAIVCWLIGAAPETIAKNINKDLEDFTGAEMAFYREKVHSRAYKLGANVLESKGVIHIVDRIGIRSWNDKDLVRAAVVEMHSELAGADYLVDKNNAYLRRTPKGVSQSSISMMSENRFNDAIEALSSMKSTRKE
ncbi:methyltransferase domain-containing protein [Pseudomonas sp. GD03696]|uniref:class I SAM-dependent methyltransferase n=1 Tax=Pseudomonas sp. GD03696 TaxID=2975368 RepID=UPI00244A4DCA|nr:methyltransferase domain-containing protein [Pseudomonas sp. GD03696]MDH1932988.1 methyltransferase domain-containing protein [Pseudomonas sp. GD03696]